MSWSLEPLKIGLQQYISPLQHHLTAKEDIYAANISAATGGRLGPFGHGWHSRKQIKQ
jgi:hypothetical protein